MNALLLDDEQPVLESLAGKLGLFCPEVNVVAQCNTVDEAIGGGIHRCSFSRC